MTNSIVIIMGLVAIANMEESESVSTSDTHPMREKTAQRWAAQTLGRIGTEDSIRGLAKISDWNVRHDGFSSIKTSAARPILIEMMQNSDLAYSACEGASQTGYADNMRDALIELINLRLKAHDGIGHDSTATRAIRSLAAIAEGDNSTLTIEFLLSLNDLFVEDKFVFVPIKDAIDKWYLNNK